VARIPVEAIEMSEYHVVENVKIENEFLSLVVDGVRIEKSLREVSSILADAKSEEQKNFEVSPSGYGIHWPLIDEDISIDGLLGIVHRPENSKKIA
jgi:hypothetical protein